MGRVHDLTECRGVGKSVWYAKIRVVEDLEELKTDPELYVFPTQQSGVLHHCQASTEVMRARENDCAHEAYQLLTSRRVPSDGEEENQARQLAADLGYHALALDLTASALVSSVATNPFGDFRAKLARPDKDALVLAEKLADALPNGHEKSIAQTMLRSLRGLGAEGQDFLRLVSLLAVAPIPASLATAVFQEADKLSREDAEDWASLALQQVTSASLADPGEKRDARTVHTSPSCRGQCASKKKDSPERTEVLRTAAIVVLRAAIATAAEDPRLYRQVELQVTHARQVVPIPATAHEADLVASVARYDYERGAYASAQTLYERELDFRSRVLGPEHPATSTSVWNVFRTLRDLGELAAGLAVLKRDLLWLLDRAAASLGADQRTVRQYVAKAIKKNV